MYGYNFAFIYRFHILINTHNIEMISNFYFLREEEKLRNLQSNLIKKSFRYLWLFHQNCAVALPNYNLMTFSDVIETSQSNQLG